MGKYLADQLAEYGFTQADLASASNLDKRVVSQMVAGHKERLTEKNILRWFRGAIYLGILTEPHEVTYWLKQFYIAKGYETDDLPKSLQDLGSEGNSILELIDYLKEKRKRELKQPKYVTMQRIPVVGRDEDIEEILVKLETVRLVPLVGVPGVGKTELARQIGEEAKNREKFLTIRTLFLANETTTQGAMGKISPELRKIRHQVPMLLILDNVEQIPDFIRELYPLLEAHTQLTILATSRTQMTRDDFLVRTLDEHDSVNLFLACANFNGIVLELNEQNTPAIVALCRGFDGLPLALLMASSWIEEFSLEDILGQLETREIQGQEYLLSDSQPDRERHLSLDHLIGWSYKKLKEPEQRLFRRLVVFVGECSSNAVRAICDLGDLEIQSTVDIDNLLRNLRRHHLITFVLKRVAIAHKTLHDFAWRKFLDTDDASKKEALQVTERYINYYYQLTNVLIQDVKGKQQAHFEKKNRKKLRRKVPVFLRLFVSDEQSKIIDKDGDNINAVYEALLCIRHVYVTEEIESVLGEEVVAVVEELITDFEGELRAEVSYLDDEAVFKLSLPEGMSVNLTDDEWEMIGTYSLASMKAIKKYDSFFSLITSWRELEAVGGNEWKLEHGDYEDLSFLLHGIMLKVIPMALEQERIPCFTEYTDNML